MSSLVNQVKELQGKRGQGYSLPPVGQEKIDYQQPPPQLAYYGLQPVATGLQTSMSYYDSAVQLDPHIDAVSLALMQNQQLHDQTAYDQQQHHQAMYLQLKQQQQLQQHEYNLLSQQAALAGDHQQTAVLASSVALSQSDAKQKRPDLTKQRSSNGDHDSGSKDKIQAKSKDRRSKERSRSRSSSGSGDNQSDDDEQESSRKEKRSRSRSRSTETPKLRSLKIAVKKK